jgi:hypothetical protein
MIADTNLLKMNAAAARMGPSKTRRSSRLSFMSVNHYM